MALSGAFNGTFSGTSGAYPRIEWSGSQNISGNYTNVNVNLYFIKTSSWAWNLTGSANANININGNNSNSSITFDLRTASSELVRSRSLQVDHNSDGTKSCYIGADGNTQVSWGTFNFGQTVTLDTIPREAYVTNSVNFTVGDDIPLTIWNGGNYWVKADLYVNSVLIKSVNLGQVTSATLTLDGTDDSNIYAQMPNDTSKAMFVRLRTYSASNYTGQIGGNKDKSGTASINQTTNKPVFTSPSFANVDKTINVVDTYGNALVSSSTETLTGSSTKMIKGYSKVRATVAVADKMVAQNSATEVKYRFSTSLQQIEAAYSAGSDVEMDLDNVSLNAFTVTAFDSRNLTTAVNGSLAYMANYFAVSAFNMALARDNNVDAPVTLSFDGLMFKEYFGGGSDGVQNTLTAHYRFKNTTHAWEALDGTVTITIASPGVVSKTAHGFQTGDQVWFSTTGALPTGLSADTIYYVIWKDADSFWLATSAANAQSGTKINTSGGQSGVHTVHGDSMWEAITPSVDGSGNISFSDYVDGDLGASGFDTNKSFTIQIRLFDKLSFTIVESTLSVGIPLMDFTQAGVALGAKYDEGEGGLLQVNAKNIVKYVGELLYPVGSLYYNATDDTNPGTLLGFGTWTAFGAGRVPVGYNSGDSDFNAGEKTGGAKTVTLSTSHEASKVMRMGHIAYADDAYSGSGFTSISKQGLGSGSYHEASGGTGNARNRWNFSWGSGSAHSNVQPYITVFMWKRTA